MALLDDAFAARPLAQWRELLDGANVTYGVVQTLEECAHDPQLLANKILVPTDGGGEGRAGPRLTVDSPVRLDQEQRVRRRRAPDLGEHTLAVLTELGFDAVGIEGLMTAGAIPSGLSSGGTAAAASDATASSGAPAAGTPTVRTEEHDGIFVITIDRPNVRNAVDGATARALADAFDRLDARKDLAVGVLTGAGGTFSAGMDLRAFAAGDTPIIPGQGFAGLTRREVRKPLIAAVEGWALGGGTEMALACDLIIAAQDATFGLTEVTFGLVPPEGGIVRLPERIPRNVALELLLTGEPLSAVRAEQFGLVNHLTPHGEALSRAVRVAGQIARNAPLSVAAVKRAVTERTAFADQDALRQQDQIVAPVLASADAKEGAHAFAEKRAPQWQGR